MTEASEVNFVCALFRIECKPALNIEYVFISKMHLITHGVQQGDKAVPFAMFW